MQTFHEEGVWKSQINPLPTEQSQCTPVQKQEGTPAPRFLTTEPPAGLRNVRIPTFQKVLWDTVPSKWVQWKEPVPAVDGQMWALGPSLTDSLLTWVFSLSSRPGQKPKCPWRLATEDRYLHIKHIRILFMCTIYI